MSLRSHAVEMLLSTFHQKALEGDSVKEETPERVARMWDELLSGYDQDPEEILSKSFDADARGALNANGIVVVKDIEFYSQCEHHLLPFFGKCSIAYIPRDKVVGLSKFARLVSCFARRLQVQERMTNQIMEAIQNVLNPLGVMVIVEAEHMCMSMRGIRARGAATVTSRVSGVFYDSYKVRDEALHLLGY